MQTIETDHPRLRWIQCQPSFPTLQFGQDVIQGLQQTPKTVPCRYFYDDLGSKLFEQICDQPEYYPTRTEQQILDAYASEIAEHTGICDLIELGSGSSRKTRLLLDAYSDRFGQIHYCPIDVSTGILKATALDLLNCYPQLRLCGLAGTYEEALGHLPAPQTDRRMVIFLGSTMGNLRDRPWQPGCPSEQAQFLTHIQNALQPGDYFLLGVDLQKPIEILEAAYNDANGITAAFNLNVLRHLNHRYQGNFNLSQFEHWAFYNTSAHQIEMHLRSRQSQMVELAALDLAIALEKGETIHTEISRKFHLPSLLATLNHHALNVVEVWTDPQSWFALILSQRHIL